MASPDSVFLCFFVKQNNGLYFNKGHKDIYSNMNAYRFVHAGKRGLRTAVKMCASCHVQLLPRPAVVSCGLLISLFLPYFVAFILISWIVDVVTVFPFLAPNTLK